MPDALKSILREEQNYCCAHLQWRYAVTSRATFILTFFCLYRENGVVLGDQGKMGSLEDRWVIDAELKLLSSSTAVLLLLSYVADFFLI